MRIILDLAALFSIVLIVFLLSFVEKRLSSKLRKFLLYSLVAVISIIIGFKVIGLDHQNYVGMFSETAIIPLNWAFIKTMFEYSLEPFFIALISTLKNLGLGVVPFFFISAFIPLFMIASVILKKEKTLPLLTFFIFLAMSLFRGPVDTIRHFFAAAIYLHALYSLSKNNKIRFYAKSLFSILVHYSNIAILFVSPFLKLRWSIFRYVVALLFSVIIAFLTKGFITDIVMNMNVTTPIMAKFQYYFIYSSDDMEFMNGVHAVLWTLLTYSIVLFVIIINLIALNYIKEFKKDNFYYLLLNSQIIGSVLLVFLTAFEASNFGLRMNFLFSVGCFFIVKELLVNRIKEKKFFFVFVLLFLAFYNFVILLYFAGVYSPDSRFSLV